jgi:hypothetical protein
MVLDTGHIHAHGGAQREWLAKTLAEGKETPFKMAAYHVPLYPSRRDFDMRRAVEGRRHWMPLFDLHGLDIAFEHHDHTHKRTKPLRGNAVDPDGTLYVGDGAFGSGPSYVRDPDAWYLATSSRTLHFWVADVTSEGFDLVAVNESGEVFDAVP